MGGLLGDVNKTRTLNLLLLSAVTTDVKNRRRKAEVIQRAPSGRTRASGDLSCEPIRDGKKA